MGFGLMPILAKIKKKTEKNSTEKMGLILN